MCPLNTFCVHIHLHKSRSHIFGDWWIHSQNFPSEFIGMKPRAAIERNNDSKLAGLSKRPKFTYLFPIVTDLVEIPPKTKSTFGEIEDEWVNQKRKMKMQNSKKFLINGSGRKGCGIEGGYRTRVSRQNSPSSPLCESKMAVCTNTMFGASLWQQQRARERKRELDILCLVATTVEKTHLLWMFDEWANQSTVNMEEQRLQYDQQLVSSEGPCFPDLLPLKCREWLDNTEAI